MTLAKRVKKTEDDVLPRLKLMLFGAAGVGKTFGSMWPNSYLIDGERGTAHYDGILSERRCARIMTTDCAVASQHVRGLMTTKHDYKTLVIDPITSFYEDSQQKWNDLFVKEARRSGKDSQAEMQDFGFRYWARVKSEQKAFLALLKRIDMNVIVTCHEKKEYGDTMKVVGQTYDGIKGLDFMFDTILRLVKVGDRRVAMTLKDRTGKFPEKFDYKYDRIRELWGSGIERIIHSVTLATDAQASTMKELMGIIQFDAKDKWESDCMRKANVSEWSEMDTTTIQKCIDFLTKKLPSRPEIKTETKTKVKETTNADAT